MAVIQEAGNGLPLDPAIPLLAYTQRTLPSPAEKLVQPFHCSSIHNSQKLEIAQIFINGRVAKENVIHLLSRMLFSC